MELLTGDDQGVADLPPDDQEDHLLPLDIIQDAEVSHSKLELGHGIGPEPLDRLGGYRGPIAEPGEDRGLQGPPLVSGQGLQLRLGLVGDRDSEGHRRTLDRRVHDRQVSSQRPHADASGFFASSA